MSDKSIFSWKWYKEVPTDAWRSLIAAGFGWFFEIFDLFMYSLTLPALLVYFSISTAVGGLIGTAEAAGMMIGGIVNGWVADKIGRVKTLMIAILTYTVFTGLTALATTATMVGVLRFLAGLGMGGEWTAGAALVAESWPPKYRGRGGALMQMGLALGSLFAILVVGIIASITPLNTGGWRYVYLSGALPALMLIYVWRRVPESKVWLAQKAQKELEKKQKKEGATKEEVEQKSEVKLKNVLLTFFFVFIGMYAYWGVFTFAPTFLVLVRHLAFIHSLSFILALQLGSLAGFLVFAAIVDRIGRRPSFISYLIIGLVGTAVFVLSTSIPLIYTGAALAGFGITGIFGGMGPWIAEMVPRTRRRGFLMGLAYNGGRVGGVIAPYVVGALAVTVGGFIAGLLTTALMLGIGIVIIAISPETKGTVLS